MEKPIYGSYKISLNIFHKPDGSKLTVKEYKQIQKQIKKETKWKKH